MKKCIPALLQINFLRGKVSTQKFLTLFLLTGVSMLLAFNGYAQNKPVKPVISSAKLTLVRVTPKLADIDPNSMYGEPFKITRNMKGVIGISEQGEEKVEEAMQRLSKKGSSSEGVQDPNIVFPNTPTPTIGPNFDGQNWVGIDPSDNNMAAGPNHVIQMVNATSSSFLKIWDKTGTQVQAPILLSAITGLPGSGDPVVIYDQIADRWILTEFGPGSCCSQLIIAVSATSNPTGSYNVYQYTDNSFFPDYPKFSVWHNAYYATTNDFNSAGTAYLGSSIWAFDRTAMIAGAATATMVRFRQTGGGNPFYNMGTVCLEGTTPATQNGLFIYPDGGSNLGIFELTPNFANPPASVVGAVTFLPITAYTQPPANISQQGSGTQLNTLGSRMMFRMNYRNRGGTETIVATHTVGVGGLAAVRWYELRRVAGNWTVFQQGTLANPDGNSRWMGGISMDANGTIGLIYDLAGTTSFPSVKMTGRNLTDPVNTMTLSEQTIVNGTAPHTTSSRWGDYNTLVSDPSTVGSFWGTSEYSSHSTRMFNFTLSNGAAAPVITAGTSSIVTEGCAPANGAIDPNETVTVSFCLQNVGTLNTTNLVGTLLPTGGVTAPSAPQNYGVVVAGGAAVCRNFTFTATTACGGNLVASIQLQDGATNLGTLTYNFVTGAVSTIFTQNFDAVAAPALPAGWAAANAAGPAPLWVTSSASSVSAPNSIFVDDPSSISDKIIETPTIAIASAGASLTFRNNFDLESGFDGGVLEISINAAAYQDIITAGGVFTANGYTGAISSSFGSPIAGRNAWTGSAGSFLTSTVTLPPAAAGQNVKFRFRMGSDNSVAQVGWRIDDVSITQRVCCVPAVAPTVTINQAALQPDPTSTAPINFSVVFSEPVTGFTQAGVNLSGTAGGTLTKIVSSTGPNTYNVAVSGMTTSGTVIANIPANAATGTVNVIGNAASTSTDNTVTWNAPVGCLNVVSYTGPAVPIPDNTPAGINIPITVSGVGSIFDLDFRFDAAPAATCDATVGNTNAAADHTFIGDLVFTLTSPNATSVVLVNRRGGTRENICTTLLDDDGAYPSLSTVTSTSGQTLSGNFAPDNPLSAFDGQNANGVWTLNVSDNASIDVGSMRRFSLIFNGGCCVPSSMVPRANDTVCAGSTAGPYNFTSVPPGATFNWTNNNTAIGLGASGSGNIPAFTATNPTTAPITGTITVTPQFASPIVVTGSLAAGDGILTQRIFRDGVVAACATPKAYPGTFATVGSYFYDTYNFTNTSPFSQCVSVTISSTTIAQAHATAYNGSFNPANQATNYLGDAGTSATVGTPQTFSFTAAPGATIVFVVTEPINGETNPSYTLTINNLAICTGNPSTFNIRVLPVGNVNAIPNQVVCKGQPTAPVTFTGTVPNTVFNWTNNNTLIGLAATGNGNIPSFIAQNPTLVPQVATITVTPVYSPGGPGTPITTNFAYTGAVQTWTVPAGVTSVTVKTWGAQGNTNALGVVGGLGGYAEGTLAVTPGQTLFVNVGGGATSTITGGFNGGGAAGVNAGCAQAQGGGGGGASDIRVAVNTLAARAIVAGGGGGAGANRVAGCGRGTGGGGGGGYFGGGGGAGWPGIPGSEGPVPTGGTQSAGGAGGVTTFSPGPTNGFPGASGVGGAGGTEVGSAQGGSATAESGGIGGGLTGGSGLYNNANNWCGQSGAGGSSYIGGVTTGLTTPGLRAGNGQVQITYAPLTGVTCPGTPRSFTITVNPNPDIVIIADPGTTICEGDPTLLTVVTGTSSPLGTLYTQGTGVPANGSPSQVFEPANAAFSSQGADDFTVPAGATWSVTQVTTSGINTAGGVPTSVNVFFYSNSGANLPGAAIASYNNVATFVRTGANYVVTLPSALNLAAGTYWMSFQVNMSFATSGQWFWGNFGAANIGNQYAWQNPGGGFGTPCTSWGYGATGCGVGGTNRNNYFSIIGTSVVGGGPLPPGYTFLWSPAAGLSSTTSNPVAASPMNSTLYTVNVTSGQGCTNQASIFITVNKRPTVTTQPISRVNCSGTSATFTVGGTGTGLTYQWQVSPTGVGGPWSNVPTTPPYFNGTTATLTINPVNTTMNGYAYRCILGGVCAPIGTANISNPAVLTVNPLPNITVTPPVSCGGVQNIFGTLLTVTAAPPAVPGNVSVNSGAINVPIPDGTGVAATSNLTVAGVPANATITEVKVNMNITHTWVGDLDVNIKSPSANLNLVGRLDNGAGGNATDNFVNTTFSSLGGLTISGAPVPRTGTFTAEARPLGPIGFVQTTTTWTGAGSLIPTATSANGVWTIAAGDFAGIDVGSITNWSISIDYTTPGTGTPPPMTFTWAPLAGLYNNSLANVPYLGTNTPTVYAAPTVQTTYVVTATDIATGCTSTASALVNYTPPPPTVTPNPVTMCLGDPAVRLVAATSTAFSTSATTGTISVNIPDNNATPTLSTLNIAGIPVGATITGMSVALNMTHTYPADMIINLKAPNNQILSLYKHNTNTDNGAASVPTAGFYNAIVNSSASTQFVAVPTPFRYGQTAPAGPYRPDALNGVTNPGYPVIMDPTGYVSNAPNFPALYSTPNGTYTLAMADGGGGDLGVFTGWTLTVNYLVGVPATPATWSPTFGLFNDAAGTPYIGDARDTVWTRPTPAGVYNYDVTARNIISTTSTINTPMAGGNGNFLVTFNVRNNNAIPVTFSSIASNTFGSGAITATVFYKPSAIAGNPGPISAANGWNSFGSASSTVTAGTLNQLISGMTLQIPPGATYGIALDMTGATFPAYTNGTGAVVTYSNGGCDLMVDGNVGWGGPNAPGTPVNNPRNFNGSVTLLGSGPGTCVSPARRVVVTVNTPTTVTTQPVDQTICTDKVATFTVVAAGTGPFTYQWQVSTNGNNPPWTNITNGGVYSGATTSTLTITAPPVSFNGNFYRVVINGAAPCGPATSNGVRLTVNPLPTVVISANPYTSLFPGLRTTLSSTVTPNAASTYTWLRNGAVVPGATAATLLVDVDGLGDYQLRVTDVNTCTNVSNIITIKDSASGRCFLYPNPTSGKFQVRYYSVANNVLPRTLTIYDTKGDRMFTQLYTIGRPYDRMDVDMRAYGKGLYWVEIGDANGNRLAMCRVVIQ